MSSAFPVSCFVFNDCFDNVFCYCSIRSQLSQRNLRFLCFHDVSCSRNKDKRKYKAKLFPLFFPHSFAKVAMGEVARVDKRVCLTLNATKLLRKSHELHLQKWRGGIFCRSIPDFEVRSKKSVFDTPSASVFGPLRGPKYSSQPRPLM